MGNVSGKPRWTGAVIGLGRVGMGYDYDSSDGTRILSHANAFWLHPGFSLVGGVDPDPGRRLDFTKKFGCPAFGKPEELFAACSVDVVALAVPTLLHYESFCAIEQYPWRLLLCEKPIAPDLNQARAMVERMEGSGRVMAVNYMRRTEPGANTVRAMVREGILGDIHKGTVWYSKGLLNNGSHFVDLLTYWLGEARDVRVLSAGRVWNGMDPEPDVRITFGETAVYFLAGREEQFNVADIELMGTEGKLLYGRSGTEILHWRRAPDTTRPGFIPLTRHPVEIANDAARFQYHVLGDVLSVLDGMSKETVSNGHTGLRTLETVLAAFAERNA